ncbi:MAG: hypothetical protein DRQ61_01045 [Gammaproteobacteria bacterium]|nr:MAG: hypothetical protein DRQ61_01045 [Gammaproteobacteria bacterium]
MQNPHSKEKVSLALNQEGVLTLFSECEIKKNSLLKLTDESATEEGEEPIQLLEGCGYEYELPKGYWLKPLGGIVQVSRRDSRYGRITPNIYVGRLALTVEHEQEKSIELAVEVRSIKADYRSEYRKMLEDITTECTELLMQHSSAVTQKFSVDYEGESASLYQRFAFVQSIVASDTFRNAVHRITSMPATAWSEQLNEIDIRRARRIGSQQIRQIASRSNRTKLSSRHPLASTIGSIPSRLSNTIKVDSVDTPENRFVKHVLKEFERFCGAICQQIEGGQPDTSKRPQIYYDAKSLEARFSEYLNHPVFQELNPPHSLPLNSPVLQRKSGYREVLRVWLMYELAAKLVWSGLDESYPIGKRDVATLYEYWLFFKLLRLVETIFSIEPKETKALIKETSDGLGLQLLAGQHTAIKGDYIYQGRELTVQFNYNRTFSPSDYPKSGSWTQQMRPDYTLSLWPKAFSETEAEEQELIVHVHFDAKYKVEGLEYLTSSDDGLNDHERMSILNAEKSNQKRGDYKRADLLKMHAYKDAIRRTVGAYLLYPGTADYQRRGFHEVIPGLGAFPVSPSENSSGIEAVGDFIREVAEHFSNRASQREQLTYHQYAIHKKVKVTKVHEIMPEYLTSTTKIRPQPPSESAVLIGFYNSDQEAWIKDKGLYNIRLDSKGLKLFGVKEAGAKYLLLRGKGQFESGDIWQITSKAPELVSQSDLRGKGYPRDPSCDYYLLYHIYPVDPAVFGHQKWDIRKLSGYSIGRANTGRPFAVTLSELSAAVAL